ncbi:MAG TPA: DUF883 family protein [Verrucomicrobiae bacterium]|nr:DUF883 family protein [Verrucomicrobiae bacterium]
MNTVERNTEKIVSDLKCAARDSEELLESTSDAIGDKAREVRERLSETLKSANRTCRALEDRWIQTAKAADKLVREHPYPSAGFALALGFIVGAILSRK